MLCPEDMGYLDPVGFRDVKLNAPQLFVDDYLVENRFDRNFLSANVPHVFHPPERSPDPLLHPDRPWEREYGLGYPGIVALMALAWGTGRSRRSTTTAFAGREAASASGPSSAAVSSGNSVNGGP